MLRKFPQKQRNSVDLATVPLRLLHLREEEQQIKAFSAAVDSYLIFKKKENVEEGEYSVKSFQRCQGELFILRRHPNFIELHLSPTPLFVLGLVN